MLKESERLQVESFQNKQEEALKVASDTARTTLLKSRQRLDADERAMLDWEMVMVDGGDDSGGGGGGGERGRQSPVDEFGTWARNGVDQVRAEGVRGGC